MKDVMDQKSLMKKQIVVVTLILALLLFVFTWSVTAHVNAASV